jgi:hypothetical protein
MTIHCWTRLLGSGDSLWDLFGTAGAATGRLGENLADQFSVPNAGDELAGAVIVEFDGGTVIVTFNYGAIAIKFVADGLAFNKNLHLYLQKDVLAF